MAAVDSSADREKADALGESGGGLMNDGAAAVLEITLVRAKKLKNASKLGTSDQYVTDGVANGRRAPAKSSVVVDELNPAWNETYRIIVDDPEEDVLSLVISDYSALADDIEMRKMERCVMKTKRCCCGWRMPGRRKKKLYRTLSNGKRVATRSGSKLDKKDTKKPREQNIESGALFHTIMGTAEIADLSDLVPFEETTRELTLTKDASSIFRVLSKKKSTVRKKAGTLTVKFRLYPLAKDLETMQKALARAGLEARKFLQMKRAEAGVSDPKVPMIQKITKEKYRAEMAENRIDYMDPEKTAEHALTPQGRLKRPILIAVEQLLSTVLEGDPRNGNESTRERYERNLSVVKPFLNGLLYFELIKGEDLKNCDGVGSSDPYFKIKLKTQTWKSKVMANTVNPVYNDGGEFVVSPSDLTHPGVDIVFTCWDKDMYGKEFMGKADVPLRHIVARALANMGHWSYERLQLKGVDTGYVHAQFRFQPVDATRRRNARRGDTSTSETAARLSEDIVPTPKGDDVAAPGPGPGPWPGPGGGDVDVTEVEPDPEVASPSASVSDEKKRAKAPGEKYLVPRAKTAKNRSKAPRSPTSTAGAGDDTCSEHDFDFGWSDGDEASSTIAVSPVGSPAGSPTTPSSPKSP